MKRVTVRYPVKADRAAHDRRFVESVFAELRSARRAGLRYASFVQADGVSLLRRAAVLAIFVLAGCAGLPDHAATPHSTALAEWSTTRLGRIANASLDQAAPLGAGSAAASAPPSGFHLLPVASAALETRLALARLAEKTLDVQYFAFNGDSTGRHLMDHLREAAQRGVHVRLLVDDLHSDSAEAALSALAAFDNVEVRLFNPFTRLRGSVPGKLVSSLDVLSRVNHRMHNKLFAADNALIVFGGRNIADEYFMRASEVNFIDVDILGAGPVVRALTASFDTYWNSAVAFPIDRIVPSDASRV